MDFIKPTSFSLIDKDGSLLIENLSDPDFIKSAETSVYEKPIIDFLLKLNKKEGKSYFLVNAMGASDYFGSNLNADYFSDKVLEDYHKSFETEGHVYRHHKNKDSSIADGKVLFSHYNKKMHRVELIVEVDDNKVQDILDKLKKNEMAATSMACFQEGTGIIISNFKRKNIEDIVVGDKVLTHSGQLQKVKELHVREYNDTMFTIQPVGKYREAVTCTKDHPWLVIDTDKFYSNDNSKNKFSRNLNLKIEDAVLKNAEDLTGEEYLIVPKPSINKDTDITKDMAKLLGWYLAEGHTHINDNGVEFTVNRTDQIVTEIKETAKFLNTEVLFRDHNMSLEALRVIIYSDYLKDYCLKYCGKYCDRKILNEEIFSWPDELKLAFLGAYISGDGFYYKNIYISSVNKELLEQIQWLCYSLGIITTLGRNIHKVGKQRFTDYDQTEWILRFRKTANIKLASYCDKIPDTETISIGGSNGPYEYKDFYLVGIDTIEVSYYNGLVYNLEVEKDETYVVEQYAAHNCKVSYDVCAICGNKAKSRDQYCMHLKHFKNKIHTPNTPIPGAKSYGQKVYAINPDPKFFDISFVTIPADATSSVLTKLAEVFTPKKASITKKVVVPIDAAEGDNATLVQLSHGSLTKEEMKKLLTKYSMPEIMTHMVDMNMFPSRKDFQYMQMITDGLSKDAEYYYDSNIIFDCKNSDVSQEAIIEKNAERVKFNSALAEELSQYGERLGLGRPLVLARILSTDFEKIAEETVVNTVPYFAGLGGAYWAYNHLMDKKRKALEPILNSVGISPGKVPPAAKYKGATWLMRQHPLLFASGLVGAGLLANTAQRMYLGSKNNYLDKTAAVEADYFKKLVQKPGFGQFLTTAAIASPLIFLYSAYNRDRLKKGLPVSHLGQFSADHPFMLAGGTIGASYIPEKIIKMRNKGMFGKVASLSDYLSYLSIEDNDAFEDLYKEFVKVT